MTSPPAQRRTHLLRFALLIALLLFATWCASALRQMLNLEITPGNQEDVHRAIMVGALAYIGLLALPFVPGAEIGLAMLAAFGPGIAPLIYGTTVIAMMLAYMIGRYLPIGALERLLSSLRLKRAADLVARAAPMVQEERLSLLLEGQPPKLLNFALRYRYLAIALAVNTPGNSFIGGGGGIMMIAGLSGIFSPMQTFLTILVAVAPVPLLVFFLGMQV